MNLEENNKIWEVKVNFRRFVIFKKKYIYK